MKLLGWMHRKLRQSSGEPVKSFVIGQEPSDHDQQYFTRTSMINNKKPFKQASQRELNIIKSLSVIGLQEAARSSDDEDDDYKDVLSISEIFPGFLAIGTLGSPSDPPSPKFSISIDHMITETETEKATPNELTKLINNELEKVLDPEVVKHEKGWTRNNNHESTVTTTTSVVCPLQGYLFGPLVELSETTTTVAKKENRTSLGELFQRSKLLEEGVCENYKLKVEKEGDDDKYGMQLIKKKLKKKILNAANFKTSSNSTPPADGHLSQTKLHKILHLFNKKVYPESTIMAKEKWDHKAQKNDKKKKNNH